MGITRGWMGIVPSEQRSTLLRARVETLCAFSDLDPVYAHLTAISGRNFIGRARVGSRQNSRVPPAGWGWNSG